MSDWWNDAGASEADAPAAPDTGAPAANVIGVDGTYGTADPGELEAEQLISDLETLQRERDDLLDTTKRLQADFENYRKRVLREQTGLVERASESIVEQLLPVLDSFELAVANLDGEGGSERVRKGIELVYAELFGVLERAGWSRSPRTVHRSTPTSTKR